VGSYTAADSTVPVGLSAHAETALGQGLSGTEKDFEAIIGDDPGHATNVSQWTLIFDGYHGVGRYAIAPALSSHFDIFAAVWCGGRPGSPPARPPQPFPNVPED
jgi:hypothetical protein